MKPDSMCVRKSGCGFSDKVRAMNLTSTQLYLRLLSYVKPYWRTFAISILCLLYTSDAADE